MHRRNVRMVKRAYNFFQAEYVKAVDMNIHTGQIMMRMHMQLVRESFFPASCSAGRATLNILTDLSKVHWTFKVGKSFCQRGLISQRNHFERP